MVWDQLGLALPVDGRCLLYGIPALVDPKSGVILAVCCGTMYALRIPDDVLGAAKTAGARTHIEWSSGGVTDIQDEFGQDWIFGLYLVQELQWCRAVCEAMDHPPASRSKPDRP